jgi:SSS family solute:Na+ symporter
LVGLLGSGIVVQAVTRGMFPETFPGQLIEATGKMAYVGSVPAWLSGLVICGVVLFYIFLGGVRGAAWANTFQTVVFMLTSVVAFGLIAHALGGVRAATQAVVENAPGHLVREGHFTHLQFVSYMFVPLSVGMFPHLFQHWLTAKSARTFRLSIIAHPFFIMLVWVPCILIGIWAAGMGLQPPGGNSNAVLGVMVDRLLHDPLLTGLMTAGILAAIMSSLDSQFVCLGTMFTHDIVVHWVGEERLSDKGKVLIGRIFVVAIVAVVYVLSLFPPPHIFDLGVWCFSGFAGLFPLVVAALYWRRATRAGAFSCVLVMAGVWSWFFYDGLIRPVLAGGGTGDGGEGGEGYLFHGMMPVVPITVASAAAMILVSLATRPPRREHVDRFLARYSA